MLQNDIKGMFTVIQADTLKVANTFTLKDPLGNPVGVPKGIIWDDSLQKMFALLSYGDSADTLCSFGLDGNVSRVVKLPAGSATFPRANAYSSKQRVYYALVTDSKKKGVILEMDVLAKTVTKSPSFGTDTWSPLFEGMGLIETSGSKGLLVGMHFAALAFNVFDLETGKYRKVASLPSLVRSPTMWDPLSGSFYFITMSMNNIDFYLNSFSSISTTSATVNRFGLIPGNNSVVQMILTN
jgi:hypothetical protein